MTGPRASSLGAAVPRRGNRLTAAIGTAVLKVLGWRIEGEFPNLPKMVMIGAPHTSNWDFVVGIAAGVSLRLGFTWVGKHQLFRGPFDRVFRWLGGLPVDRRSPHGVVGQLVDEFNRRSRFLLGMAPEGTRSAVTKWRTGFYYIADGASVPILPVVIDRDRKVIQLLPIVTTSGDLEADVERIRKLYADLPTA